jgi:protein TonB
VVAVSLALPRPSTAFPRPLPFSWRSAGLSAPPPSGPSGRRGSAIDLSPGPLALNSRGEPPRAPHDADAAIRVTGAQVGADWIQALHEWWLRHRYYPSQALVNGEDGTVQIHLSVDRYGKVQGVEMRSTSGSQWLDMAALATFRGAKLPPFPSNTPEPRADLDLTIQYILLRR